MLDTDLEPHNSDDHRVGVVLAGGGARGAYEVGMLSVLLPWLDHQCGQRPKVFLGTSAGAINAVLFASLAHLPAQQAADEALNRWRGIRKNQVLEPALKSLPMNVLKSLPTNLARSVCGGLSLPVTLSGLLGTGPLLTTLQELIDWRQLRDNTRNPQVLEAVAVATTACGTRRTAIFAQGSAAATLPAQDPERALDYHTHEPLRAEHVLASAAIPVLFPPVRIEPGGEWHMDGGARLNVPIKPAVALDVNRVVVIATDPATHRPPGSVRGSEPAPLIQDTFANLLDIALSDRMVEDLATLAKTNALVASGEPAVSSGGRKYRVIGHLFGGPQHGRLDQLGQLATNIFNRHFRSIVSQVRHPDLALLSCFLGPRPASGELLSYVFFEPEFIEAAIALGQEDAHKILESRDCGNIWSTGAPAAVTASGGVTSPGPSPTRPGAQA